MTNLQFIREATYTCGLSTHTVREYRHDVLQMEMVLLPGGTFVMGSERQCEQPRHSVTLAPFLIAKYPVTQSIWQRAIEKNPAHFRGEERPVECVTWHQCQDFCRKFNFSLPSEAQWEYACRAGTTTEHYWDQAAEEYCWFQDNSDDETHPVGQRLPNSFGLYDMSGNVWEWCADVWHDNYQEAPGDGSSWQQGGEAEHRVIRGGSSWYPLTACSSSYRNLRREDYCGNRLGFRVVRFI